MKKTKATRTSVRVSDLEKIYDIIGRTPDVKHYGGRFSKDNEMMFDRALREIEQIVKQYMKEESR
jgi:hypothetical protein